MDPILMARLALDRQKELIERTEDDLMVDIVLALPIKLGILGIALCRRLVSTARALSEQQSTVIAEPEDGDAYTIC